MSSTTPTLADLEALQREESFVRALARSLLADDGLAEDVVQQTWLEALRRGAPDGDSRRGWLARVVRSRASNVRRGEVRRVSRERTAARPEASPGPDELLARAEQRRLVVAAVAELPEPYRTAVMLRYLEDLSPRAIAARLGVPRDTVATRLKRALGMLRERFDREHGGDRGAWAVALAPLGLPVRGAAGALAPGLLGLLAALSAMKHVLILMGAAALLALFFTYGRSPDSGSAGDSPLATGEVPPRSAAGDPAQVAVGGAGAVAARTDVMPVLPSIEPVAEVGDASLVGRAVNPDGSPAALRACRVWAFDPLTGFGSVHDPLGAPHDAGPTWRDAVTDANGRFAFDRVPPGGLHLLVLAQDGPFTTWRTLPRTPGPGEHLDLGVIVLDVRATITGTVVGPDGGPVPDAEVWAADLPGAVLGVAPFDRLEPDGALLVALPDGPVVAGAASALAWADAVRDNLSVYVLQAPAGGAFQVLPFPAWLSRLWAELPIRRTRTAVDGTFRLEGVAPGDNLVVVRAPGLEPGGRARVAVREGDVRDVGRLRLRAGEAVEVRVVDDAGAPVAGAEVRLALRPQLGLTGILFASAPRTAAADGRVVFEGVPRGEFVAAFRRAADEPWSTRGPIEAGDATDLVLPAARDVRLLVRAIDGAGLAKIDVRLWQGPPFGEATASGLQPEMDPTHHVVDEGDAAGERALRLTGLSSGPFTAVVSAPGCALETVTFVVDDEGPDVVRVGLRPAVSCVVEVVDAAGGPIAGADVSIASDADAEAPWARSLLHDYGGVGGFGRLPRSAGRTGVDGRVVAERVPAGPCVVIARTKARGIALARTDDPAQGARVVLAVPGRIVGRLSESGAAPAVGVYAMVARRADLDSGASMPDLEHAARPAPDGTFRFEGLIPGRWVVIVHRSEAAPPASLGALVAAMDPTSGWWRPAEVQRIVDVRAGAESDLRIDADPLAPLDGDGGVELRCRAALDQAPVAGASVSVRIGGGGWTKEFSLGATDAAGRFGRATVQRGPFDLTVRFVDHGDFEWTRAVGPIAGPVADVAFEARLARLRVRVIGYDGAPRADQDVVADGVATEGGSVRAAGMTGADGVAVIALPEGTYRLRADGTGGSLVLDGVAVAGSVERDLRLSSAGVVAGRVAVDTPDVGLRTISLRRSDGGFFAMMGVRDDGTFAFAGVEPGDYELSLSTRSGPFRADPPQLSVGPDGAVGLVLRLGEKER